MNHVILILDNLYYKNSILKMYCKIILGKKYVNLGLKFKFAFIRVIN